MPQTIHSPANAGRDILIGDSVVRFDQNGYAIGCVSHSRAANTPYDELLALNETQFNVALKDPAKYRIIDVVKLPVGATDTQSGPVLYNQSEDGTWERNATPEDPSLPSVAPEPIITTAAEEAPDDGGETPEPQDEAESTPPAPDVPAPPQPFNKRKK